MKPWDLFSVLTQKYCWSSKDAREFADFLIPMLDYDTHRRATAWDCLNHSWVKNERILTSPRKNPTDKPKSPIKSPKPATSNSMVKASDRYLERRNEKHNKSATREPFPDTNGINDTETTMSCKYSSRSDHSSTEHEVLIIEKSSYK